VKNPLQELTERTHAVLSQAYGTASLGFIIIAVDPASSEAIVRSNLHADTVEKLLRETLGKVTAPAGANGRPRGLG
jgi:hypothetical protein